MATETLQPEETGTPAATADAPAALADHPPVNSPPTPPFEKSAPLPPRVDAGQGIDDVLSEVSKIFGQAAGASMSLGSAATDEINDHLSELALNTPPDRTPPAPSPSVGVETAADLFRSPRETPSAPEDVAPSVPAFELPRAVAEQSTPAAEPVTDGIADRVPRLKTAWQKRAKTLMLLTVAALGGWLAGAYLTRSHASRPQPAIVHEEPEPPPAERQSEPSAQTTAINAELQSAQRRRDEAEKERAQVVARLQQLETATRTGQQSTRAAIEREQAARQKAEQRCRQADDQLRLAQTQTYHVQLARVRDVWRDHPGLALALLQDAEHCPPARRDFTWGYFYRRAKHDRATYFAHTGGVNALAWSPDGARIVTAGDDGTLKFRDAASGQETASMLAHAGGATAVAFSPRGEFVVSAGADGTVKLWNGESRALVATLFGHIGTVHAVAISSDLTTIVSGGADGTVKFWDVAGRRALATRWGSPRAAGAAERDSPHPFVRSIAISPDGRFVAAGSERTVRIWEGSNAAEKTTVTVPDGTVTALAFSPQGATLIAGADAAIYQWNVDSMTQRSNPLTVAGPVNDLCFSRDGRLLAAATSDGARLFRMAGERIETDSAAGFRLRGHVGPATGIGFSPDAQTVVTSGVDGTIRFWNAAHREANGNEPDLVLRDQQRTVAIAYSSDGKQFAAASRDAIRIWNVRDGVETAILKHRGAEITKIAFSPDGRQLASSSNDWPILVWDVEALRVRAAFNGHAGSVNSIAYSSDGKRLISASDDGTLRLWDAASGREETKLAGHAAPVSAAILSRDSRWAASAGADRTVRLWDLVQKRESLKLAGHAAGFIAVAFSPDGRFLVAGESVPKAASPASIEPRRGPLCVWRLPTGESIGRFGSPGSAVHDMVFSPDGRTLVTSGMDGVTLWDGETFERRETLRFEESVAASPIAFAPDGLTLAAGTDAAVVVWTAAPFASEKPAAGAK